MSSKAGTGLSSQHISTYFSYTDQDWTSKEPWKKWKVLRISHKWKTLENMEGPSTISTSVHHESQARRVYAQGLQSPWECRADPTDHWPHVPSSPLDPVSRISRSAKSAKSVGVAELSDFVEAALTKVSRNVKHLLFVLSCRLQVAPEEQSVLTLTCRPQLSFWGPVLVEQGSHSTVSSGLLEDLRMPDLTGRYSRNVNRWIKLNSNTSSSMSTACRYMPWRRLLELQPPWTCKNASGTYLADLALW